MEFGSFRFSEENVSMRLVKRAWIQIVLVAVTGAPFAIAQSPRFFQPSRGSRLEAGSTFEVSWAVDSDSSFEEMELVLSLDGGRTFPLRVTADISPESSRISWRVPILPAREARLALRAGSDDEPGEETIRLVSDVFEIATLPGLDLEEIFRVRGEWRTREARGSSRGGLADQGLVGDAGPCVEPAGTPETAGMPPEPASAPQPEFVRVHKFAVPSLPAPPALAGFAGLAMTIPLRR